MSRQDSTVAVGEVCLCRNGDPEEGLRCRGRCKTVVGRESRNVDLCLGSEGLVVGLCLCLFCRSSLLGHGLGNVLLTLILDIVLLLPLFRNDSLLLVAGSCLPLLHIVCPCRRQTDLVGNSPPFLESLDKKSQSGSLSPICRVFVLKKADFCAPFCDSCSLFLNIVIRTGCFTLPLPRAKTDRRRSTENQGFTSTRTVHTHTHTPRLSPFSHSPTYSPTTLSPQLCFC